MLRGNIWNDAMRADQFVKELLAVLPPLDVLHAAGLTAKFAEDLHASSCLRLKPHPSAPAIAGHAILDLMARWDTGRLEVGMIRFLADPDFQPGRVVVGKVEADPMYIDLPTGEVRADELGQHSRLLWRIAIDDDHALDAIALSNRLLTARVSTDAASTAVIQSAVDACAGAAGGDTYRQFYQMLVGQ